MRRVNVLAATSAGLLVVGLLGGTPALAAPATQVTSFTVPSEPVDLEVTAGAVLRAHIVDSVGIVEGDSSNGEFDGTTHVLINVEGAPVGGGYLQQGHLVGGTPQNGDWEFDPFTGKQPYGNWEANRIHVARLDGSTADIDLRPLGFDTVFRTIGRFGTYFDQQSPTTTQNTTLVYGGTVTLRARLYWVEESAAVRHAIPGKLVTILQEDQNEPVIDGDERQLATTTTRADGTFSVTVKPERNAFRLYMQVEKGTTADGVRYYDGITWTGQVDVKVRIGISSKPTSLPAGTIGYVQGNVIPLHAGQAVYLQRYRNGAWSKVSSATIRSSGRFTLAAQPPTKGQHRYRVYKPSDADHTYNVTPEFIITGT
jgi:hypothetical protein